VSPERNRLPQYVRLKLGRHREATRGGVIARPTPRRSFSGPPKTWPGATRPKSIRERESNVSVLLNKLIIASYAEDSEAETEVDVAEGHHEFASLPPAWYRKGRRIQERERKAKARMSIADPGLSESGE
jgi:hypothetical protein